MKIIDLSTEFRNRMPKPPSGPAVQMKYVLTPSREEEGSRGFTNKMEQFVITTHVATHIDAPSHFAFDGKNIDDYPAEFFYMVPTLLLHIPKEPYGEISEEDIKEAEKECGEVREGDLVILHTGACSRYEDVQYMESPYLNKEAAEYLANKKISMVGTDSFTVDDPRRGEKPAHVEFLCKNGILVIECIMNLEEITAHRFRSICLPLKIKEGSGGFTRMIAVIEEGQ